MATNIIKIGNDTSLYNTADSSMMVFTHNGNNSTGTPNNPNIFAARTSSKRQSISVPFRSVGPVIDYEAVQPMSVTLSGTFYGDDKVTQLKKLSHWVYSAGLKKLYISNTTFIYVFGESVSDTISGARSQFRDYTSTFTSPLPFIYTNNNSTFDLDSITSANMANNTATEVGNIDNANYYAPNIIYRWEIEYLSGSIKSIEIGAGANSSEAMTGNNKIVWQNSTGVTGNMEIWLVYPLNHQLTLQHTCLASARTSVNGSIVLKEDVIDGLKVDANSNQTFFARVNGNNSSEDKLTADYSGTACSASVTAKYWEGADYVV